MCRFEGIKSPRQLAGTLSFDLLHKNYGPVILILSADTVKVVLSGPVIQAGPPDAVLGFLGSFMYAKAE